MTTHTNDCHQCDPRISKVPARDWPEGSKREVFKYRSQYPRYLGENFGDAYKPENTDTSFYPWQPTVPIGHIPQVKQYNTTQHNSTQYNTTHSFEHLSHHVCTCICVYVARVCVLLGVTYICIYRW